MAVASNPRAPARVVFQVPLWQRFFSGFGYALCGALAAFMLAVAAYALVRGWFGMAALLSFTGSFQWLLARYVGRDFRGKRGLRVELAPDQLVLALPAGRSLIHRPPALHTALPYAEIAAIETRLEGYRTLGMAMVQRAYALRRTSGELVFLFEDRAIGSGLESSFCGPIVAAILERARAPLRELGMVEGKGGLLGVWGTEAVAWHTPGLDAAGRARIWHAVQVTGWLLSATLLTLWALSFF